eukprot:4794897-Prymnesium_polylepis.1
MLLPARFGRCDNRESERRRRDRSRGTAVSAVLRVIFPGKYSWPLKPFHEAFCGSASRPGILELPAPRLCGMEAAFQSRIFDDMRHV